LSNPKLIKLCGAGKTLGTTNGNIQITAFDLTFDGGLSAGLAAAKIHGSLTNHTFGLGVIANFSMFISDGELGRISTGGGTTVGTSLSGNIYVGGVTESNTDTFGTLTLVATNVATQVIFDQATSNFNKGITIQAREGGVEFKESTFTKASPVTIDITNNYLTVHNGKMFSTNYQDLIITAIDLDLRESGRILAKGTPTVFDTPEIKIAQSTTGNRVEVHGTNFGYVRQAIGLEFYDEAFNQLTQSDLLPQFVTNTLIVQDIVSDTSVLSGLLRVRVKRAQIKSDIKVVGIFSQSIPVPFVSQSYEQMGSSSPYVDIRGSNFGFSHNETRVYIESITNRVQYDLGIGSFSRFYERAFPIAINFTTSHFLANLFHGFDAGAVPGLQDMNAGLLSIVVTRNGVRSNATTVATIIKKPLIANTSTTLISRSLGRNRIEIHGTRFGDEGISGITVDLSTGFAGQPPLPTAAVIRAIKYTVTNTLTVLDLPDSTYDLSGELFAVVTRKRGPSDPMSIGMFSDAINIPVLTASDAERCASATTLQIHGVGFLMQATNVRIYFTAVNGIDGEHLGYVRITNFTSTSFMVENIVGLKDPANIGPLQAIVSVRGVKSEMTKIANIINIPLITETLSLKIAKNAGGNRVVIQGYLFGNISGNMAVELFADGATFRYTTVVTAKDTELVVDTNDDTTGASGNVSAIVWRSGGPSRSVVIGTITSSIEPPQVAASFNELCSSITLLNISAANMGSTPSDVRVFLTASNGYSGVQLATVRMSPFSSRKLTVDLEGVTDMNAGPLKAIVTVQSVKAVEQVVAVVHRGSQDISWESHTRNRFVSSAMSILSFNATFLLTPDDTVALSPAHADCSFAPSAGFLSDGLTVKRFLSAGNIITLPSGSGSDHALSEGTYIICVCDSDEGSQVVGGVVIRGGCNQESQYQLLPQQLTILAIPRLGLPAEPMHIRALTMSSPTFRIWSTGSKTLVEQDLLFAFAQGTNCSNIPVKNSANETSLIPVKNPDPATLSASFQLPSNVTLQSISATEQLVLSICFATTESGATPADFVRLEQQLKIIPEPTLNVETSWFVNNLYQLSFDAPAGIAGVEGDIVVLESHSCSETYTRTIVQSFPISNGVQARLQSGGVARDYAIAQGKFNELPPGTYKICFATKTSEGESKSDFRLLTTTIEIKPASAVAPIVEIPDIVPLGSDIVVKWYAGNGLDGATVAAGTWIGLYRKDSCFSYNFNRHKCHIASRSLLVNETAGEIAFSYSEYKVAGEFEARYFRGNTRHGQGIVCRGLKEIKDTHLQCMLEAAAISRAIYVDPDEPTYLSDSPGMPSGLEATFDHGEEMFQM